MGRRLLLHELVQCFKTYMGLEPLEVRFFFRQQFTKLDLALKRLIKNCWKLIQSLSIMFLTIGLDKFFGCQKSYGNTSRLKNFYTIFFFRYGPEPMEVSKSKSASVRLKTYLYDFSERTEFFWVKTPMGIKRFDIHFERYLSYLRVNFKVALSGLKIR